MQGRLGRLKLGLEALLQVVAKMSGLGAVSCFKFGASVGSKSVRANVSVLASWLSTPYYCG